MEFTRGPDVFSESITHIKLIDNKTKKQIPFPEDKDSVEVNLKALDADVIAPKPEIHLNYLDKMGRMASRFFFTAGGRWNISVTLSDQDNLKETVTLQIKLINNRRFPKDTKSFPYVGKKAHRYVGLLNGSGCRRRWDFVDTHDSLHMNDPYDVCGKYAMVSNRYHKWIDLSKDGDEVEKLKLSPIEGDAVLKEITCSDQKAWKLVHYPKCGGQGRVIAICDRSGNELNNCAK
ncbi:MAG: hypothetical protein CME62_12555 [Halobacteriovoraceae bacterium]|nr:hypothetical protein [Halobacteriovoraceae bacterium]|tara:strand:- start:5614 stop:6312 length:699 start_codon:yes stop_codon:yes gene_type:complete